MSTRRKTERLARGGQKTRAMHVENRYTRRALAQDGAPHIGVGRRAAFRTTRFGRRRRWRRPRPQPLSVVQRSRDARARARAVCVVKHARALQVARCVVVVVEENETKKERALF